MIWRNQRGVAAIEFGLVAAVLALLLPAATDLALATWANQQVGNAARAGTQYAQINCWDGSTNAVSATCASNVNTAATSATSRSVTTTVSEFCGNDSASGVTQTCALPCACASGATTGDYVSVTASTSYTPIFPLMWGALLTNGSLNLSATLSTRIN